MAAARLRRHAPVPKGTAARPGRGQEAGPAAVIRKEQQQQGQRAPPQPPAPQGKHQRPAAGSAPPTNGKRTTANGRVASIAGGGAAGDSGASTPRGDPLSLPNSKASTPRAKGGAADRLRGTSEGGSRLGTPAKLLGSGTPAKTGGGGTPSKPAANGRYLMVGPLAGSEPHAPGSRHGSRHTSTEGANPAASPPNGRRQPHGAAGKGQQPGPQAGRPQQASPPVRRHVVPITANGTGEANSNSTSQQAANALTADALTAASLARAAQPAPPYSSVNPPAASASSSQFSARKGLAPKQSSAPQAVAVDGPGWHPLSGQRRAEPVQGPAPPPGVSLQAPHAAAMLAAVGDVPGLPSLFSPQQVDWSFSAPDRTGGGVAARMPGLWSSTGGGATASSVESAPGSSAAFAALGGTRQPQPAGLSVRPLVGFSPASVRVPAQPPGFGPVPQQPHLTGRPRAALAGLAAVQQLREPRLRRGGRRRGHAAGTGWRRPPAAAAPTLGGRPAAGGASIRRNGVAARRLQGRNMGLGKRMELTGSP